MNKLIVIALLLVLSACGEFKYVMVIDTLEGGKYHVVGMTDNYMDVIKLPKDTKDGDILKIRIKKEEL